MEKLEKVRDLWFVLVSSSLTSVTLISISVSASVEASAWGRASKSSSSTSVIGLTKGGVPDNKNTNFQKTSEIFYVEYYGVNNGDNAASKYLSHTY